jgi:hypothetical protein
VGVAIGLRILPTASGGKGEIEPALEPADLYSASGKGKEKGNVYWPGANRPSDFFFELLDVFVSLDC